MIPKKIHYCWFGGAELPELAQRCILSWHQHMPDWEYVLWNEENFDVAKAPAYVQEAYAAKKFAFVSDYVRLFALEQQGGVYLDTDVEVLRSYEPLLNHQAFMGFEGNKHRSLGTNCIGSEAHLLWLKNQLTYYQEHHFVREDRSMDMTTNAEIITRYFEENGLVRNGQEQQTGEMHVFDFHHFSPITSTRVMRKNTSTYSIHRFAGSWTENKRCLLIDNIVMHEIINLFAQLKRMITKSFIIIKSTRI